MRLPWAPCVRKPMLNSVTHFQKPQAGLQAPTVPNIDSLQEPSLGDAADTGKGCPSSSHASWYRTTGHGQQHQLGHQMLAVTMPNSCTAVQTWGPGSALRVLAGPQQC